MSELTAHAPRTRSSTEALRRLVCMAMLCAVAYVVMYLSKTVFAPLTVAGLLTFDLKDVIIAIGGFLFGPISAFIISAVVSLIEMVTVSETGPVGLLMNVLSTIAFVCPASFLYYRRRSLSSAVVGLIVGGVLMTAIMLLWNYLITPLYMNVEREVVATMLPTVFLPFNVVKAAMNGALTIVIYKPVSKALRAARLAPATPAPETLGVKKSKAGITIVAVIVLATAVLLALVLADKI